MDGEDNSLFDSRAKRHKKDSDPCELADSYEEEDLSEDFSEETSDGSYEEHDEDMENDDEDEGDENDESDGADEVPDVEDALKDPLFRQMCDHVLTAMKQISGHTNVKITADCFEAIQEMVWEHMWLVLKDHEDQQDMAEAVPLGTHVNV